MTFWQWRNSHDKRVRWEGEAHGAGQFDETAVALMDQVYSTALYLARNREEAEDLVQETYLRAYRFWDSFTLGTNCKAWLLTILHNVFRNRYRDRQREQRTIEYDDNLIDDRHADESGESPSDNPEELVLSRLLDREIEEALEDFRQSSWLPSFWSTCRT